MIDEYGYNQQSSEPQQPDPGQQPRYGYAQQPQYGYAQQQATYTPSSSGQYYGTGNTADTCLHGKGSGWIMFLRVLLWIWFGALCLIGIIVCIVQFAQASELSRYSNYFSSNASTMRTIGIATLFGCVILGFFSIAGGMVALDAAANIKRTTTNTALILEELKKK